MKNRLILTLVGLGLLAAAAPVLAAQETGPEAMIARARAAVLNPDPARDAITKSLAEVLEASLLILPKTDYAEEFKARVETVRKMFEDEVLFSDKGRQYLGLAYKLVSGGKTWEVPAELKAQDSAKKGIEKATEICAKLLDSALAARQAGRNEEAVRDLISFVLLVVTPIEA